MLLKFVVMNNGNMKKRIAILIFLITVLLIPSVTFQSSSTFKVTSQYLASMPYPNSNSAVVYYNGEIYVIGGTINPNKVWIYSNGSWYSGPNLPFNIISAAAIICDNSIYVIGGYNSSGLIPYVLKLNGNSWVIVSNDMPDPAYDVMAFAYNGKIYVIGGENTTSPAELYFPPSNVIRVFYPSNDSWSIVGYMPVPAVHGAYIFNGTDLIIASGYIGYSSYTNDILIYNPQTNQWQILNGVLPFYIQGGAMAYYRGVMFLVGGVIYTAGSGGVSNAIYAYYSGNLERVGYLPDAVYDSGYTQVRNILYLAGGKNSQFSQVSTLQEVFFNFPPLSPKITSYVAGNESVSLSWTPVSLASGYEIVYWNDMGFNNSINVGNVTSYTINGLQDGIPYYFEVIAYNSIGYSSPSNVIEVIPASVPNPPIITLVKYGNDNVTIYWSPPEFTGGYPILGYYIIVKEQGNLIKSFLVNSTNLTITNLAPNVTYDILLYALNKLGNSSPYVITVTPITKAKIIAFISKLQYGFLVNWSTDFPANITLELYSQNGSVILLINNVKGNSYLFRVPQGNYTLIIVASNSAGISKYITNIIYYLPPSSPQVSLVGLGNNLYIEWNKVNSALVYLVYLNNSIVYEGPSTSVVTNISNGTYLIKVIAVNPAGASSPAIALLHYSGDYVTIVHMNIINISTVKIASASFGNDSSLSLEQSVTIILLTIMILLSIAIVTRSRNSGNEW
ncbi:galactose oxidase [Saccharolobus caldissimus]|uniref:Galactose oxidase n=2 Tax=Saccharolobus caldissimus TaxID=1702097 RepID=A0AAQ4CQ14_9CREN|nr:galactose oxidase [Saccharolobus caldissimus]